MKTVKSNSLLSLLGLLGALLFLHACNFGNATGGGGTGGEGLTGILVDQGGNAIVGAKVRVYPESSVVLAKSAITAAARKDSAVSGTNGIFKFNDLPAGRYNLEASFQRHDTLFAIFLPGIHLVKSLDLGTNTLRPAGDFHIRILGAEDSAVAGAYCSIAGSPWAAVSDTAGVCRFIGVAPGAYRIAVEAPGLSAVTDPVTVISGASADGGTLNAQPDGGSVWIPSDWVLVGARGYAFYIPPELEVIVPDWGAEGEVTYGSFENPAGSDGPTVKVIAGVFGPQWLGTASPEYRIDSIFPYPETRFRIVTYREGESYFAGLEIGFALEGYRLRLDLRANTLAGRGTALRILSTMRKWTGTGAAPGTLPMKSTLLSPAAGALTAASPAFSWSAPVRSVGTTHYRLQVATDSAFQDLVVNDSVARGAVPSSGVLDRNAGPFTLSKTHFWRVLAFGPMGFRPSEVRSFTPVYQPPPPPAPTLSQPAHGATEVPVSLQEKFPQLTWAVILDAPVMDFRVQVSTDSLFTTFVTNDSVGTSPPIVGGVFSRYAGSLAPGTRYFWRVIARTQGNIFSVPTASETRSFTTVSGPIPL